MENTTSETTKKVRNHMPQDLALLIMSKLPLKSLKRFGCVCKSWDLNFENPYFMSIFRKSFISNHVSYYDGTSLLLSMTSRIENCILLYSLFGEKFENKHKLDWPNHFPDNHGFDILAGNFTGTLCLYRRNEENVLWNPFTKEFKVIPVSPYLPPYANSWVILHGFGFDYVRDDYKLLRHVDFLPLTDQHVNDLGVPWEDLLDKQISLDPFWEIYSLRSNSWRKFDSDAPSCCLSGHAGSGERLNTEGMCHWWASKTVNEKDWCILSSFDLRNEVFIATPITSDIDDDDSWLHLVLLNGSIAVISYCFGTPTFHISVLGELGVKESWTKLFIVGPLASIRKPIGAGKNGDLFFCKKDGEIVWFDLSTQMTHELGIKGVGSHVLFYKERLIPMEGINS